MTIQILATEHMAELASKVHQRLDHQAFSYAEVKYVTFTSKEVKPHIPATVRGKDIYLFHSLYHPNPNDAIMKLLLTNDSLTRGSAKSITLVLPYMSYLRQDRKDEPRVPISARVIANLIETNPKVERIITLDMHCDQAQGFYNIPVDNLYGALVQADYFREKYRNDLSGLVIVSPDHGSTRRARQFAHYLDGRDEIGVIEKRRSGERANQVETMGYQGPLVTGKDIILYDDMIDTGGSIICAAHTLQRFGAKKVYAAASHGLFSPSKADTTAEEMLNTSGIKVVVTDSIPRSNQYQERNENWLTMLPLDQLLTKAVYESSTIGGSISSLFGGKK